MTTHRDAAEVVLRPAFARYRRGVVRSLPWLLLALGASAALFTRALLGGVGPSVVVGLAVLVAGATVAYLFLNLRNATVFAGDGYFGRTGFLGGRRVWQRAELVHVEERRVSLGQGSRPRLLFVGHDRKLLMNVPVELYSDDDVQRLVSKLGVHLLRKPDIYGAARLRREFPSAVPWWLAHPLLSALLIAVLTMVVLLVGIVALDHK